MTGFLEAPPTLSKAAAPYTPQPLPEPGPDYDQAFRSFTGTSTQSGAWRDRDLRERELLGMAMAGQPGLDALSQLKPHEFGLPLNQNVAQAILDLAEADKAHDAAAVTAELRSRPLLGHAPADALDPELELLATALDDGIALEEVLTRDWRSFDGSRAQQIARVMHRLDSAGEPVHRASVSLHLPSQVQLPTRAPKPRPPATQLPADLDPARAPRQVDPRVYGLGAWETICMAAPQRAPMLAREVRSQYRQDRLLAVTQAAHKAYRQGLSWDPVGRLEGDSLGYVTKDLADQLVSIPKELNPEFGWSDVEWVSLSTEPSMDLGLPTPPTLSPAGQAATLTR